MQPDLVPDSPGLKTRQAAALLVSHGANILPLSRPVPWWQRVLRQLQSPIIYILLFALGFDVVVWVMGVWQEYRAGVRNGPDCQYVVRCCC